MKRIKTVVAALAALVMGAATFADEAQYNKLLAQAKDYETKQQWVHAMGTYWDAMEAAERRTGEEAYKAFLNIEEAIQNGKPGLGEFDDFSLYDGWLSLCKEYEIYWNEHVQEIYTLAFLYQKGNLDMATRTATYSFRVYQITTPKFDRLEVIPKKRLHKKDWVDIPANWPTVSVFNDSSVIPTVSYTLDYTKKTDRNWILQDFDVKKLIADNSGSASRRFLFNMKDKCANGKKTSFVFPAWAVTTRASLATGKNKAGGNYCEYKAQSAFNVKFHLEDESGRVIAGINPTYFSSAVTESNTPNRDILTSDARISISGIAASDVKIMDEGKFSIVVDSFTLNPNSAELDFIPNNGNNADEWAKITKELPPFDITPKTAFKGLAYEDVSRNRTLMENYFLSENTPDDAVTETELMLIAAKNASIGSIGGVDGECYRIAREAFGLDSHDYYIYKTPLGESKKALFYVNEALERVLSKVDKKEYKRWTDYSDDHNPKTYYYRTLTAAEKEEVLAQQEAEKKAQKKEKAKNALKGLFK